MMNSLTGKKNWEFVEGRNGLYLYNVEKDEVKAIQLVEPEDECEALLDVIHYQAVERRKLKKALYGKNYKEPEFEYAEV